MRGQAGTGPGDCIFTPSQSTIDTPASTRATSDISYRGDTILPSIELSDSQTSINTINESHSTPSKTEAFPPLFPTVTKDHSLSPPSQPPSFGLSTIKDYEGNFTFRSLYNATPEPGVAGSDKPSPPLTDTDKEAISEQPQQSNVSVKGLSNSFRRLDLDASSKLGDKVSYDVKNEIPPSEPYFDPAFQEALKKGLRLAGKIAACLQQCDLAQKPDSDLHKLYRTARDLESFESPATRTIGIVGDSATGKSSLINSLLDCSDLAHKGDQGFAVTSFVTEYRHRSKHHKNAFTIEVEYFNEIEIDEQLHELLWSYRQPFIIDKETEVGGREYEEMGKQSAVALATLKGIFGSRAETEPKFLQNEHGFDSILDQLRKLACAIEWPEGAQDGKWSSTAETAQRCHELTGVFMKEGLWPLTKIVRIYLSAQVLKTGVILADLPGYRDVNFARVKAAERYLFNCDEVFVVANVVRVMTDQSVHSIVSEHVGKGYKKAKDNLTIICTHADEINVGDAEKSYWGPNKRVTPEIGKAARQRIELAMKGKDYGEIEKARASRKYLYVEARNEHIREEFVKAYSDFFSEGDLNVFFVANKDYEGDIYDGAEAHALAVEGSGIPGLRSFCHSIPARAQFRATNHFLGVQLRSLIQSVELWVSAAARDSRLKVPSAHLVDRLRQSIEDSIECSTDELSALLEERVSRPMEIHKVTFNDGASDASKEWNGWHHESYKAFVRRNGTHHTYAIGYRCWNQEIIATMNRIMAAEWQLFETQSEKLVSASTQTIEKHFDKLTAEIRKLDTFRLLVKIMKTQKTAARYILAEELESMLQGFRSIKRDATEAYYNSYILEEMLSTYRSCANVSRDDLKDSKCKIVERMREIMAMKMDRKTIFPRIRRRIEMEMTQLFDQRDSNLMEKLGQVCEQIAADVRVVRDSEATLVEENPEFLDLMKRTVTEAKETLDQLQDAAVPARADARKRSYI